MEQELQWAAEEITKAYVADAGPEREQAFHTLILDALTAAYEFGRNNGK